VPSRRDQLFSYQLMVRRVVSAFAYRDAEAAQVPFPRAVSTFFISVMAAVLGLAAAGIYGVLSPGGNKTWRSEEVLIVEKETGARYVYLNNRLHPVLNYVSGLLILKRAQPAIVRVSQASLRGAARGAPLGIPGAPDTLPDRTRLRKDRWVLCSRPATTQTGQSVAATVLYIGGLDLAGQGISEQALLVSHPDHSVYFVWRNRRFLIRQPQLVLNALALGQAQVVAAGAAWINGIPQGGDIGVIDIPGRGTPGSLRDTLVGQVVMAQSQGGERQYHVVLADGIADITQVQADIILNDPATAAAYPNRPTQPVPRTDLAAAKRSARVLLPLAGPGQPPSRTPGLAPGTDQSALCASFAAGGGPHEITVGARLPPPDAAIGAARVGGGAGVEVVVPAGDGVVVESVVSPDAPVGTLAIVTDLGVRHALASREVLSYLGYDAGVAVRMPATLVATLREGPALDPERASLPAGPG
jgi:ESX secretion system ATPase EccB